MLKLKKASHRLPGEQDVYWASENFRPGYEFDLLCMLRRLGMSHLVWRAAYNLYLDIQMTISVAWVRALPGNCEELVMSTDSRLTGGRTIDCCPKILTSPRSDCAICFAGDTDFAYPLMMLLSYAIENHYPSRTRALDITHLKSHVNNICNQFLSSVKDSAIEHPDISLVLGGYSWIRKEFVIYRYTYSKGCRCVTCEDVKGMRQFGKIAKAGDWKRKASYLLQLKMKSCGGYTDSNRRFNMEPFAVVRDLLRSATPTDSIGGPVQVVKVYQHMNCRALAVYWPNAQCRSIALSGRLIHGYERIDCRVMDPDTFITCSADKALMRRPVHVNKKLKISRVTLLQCLRGRYAALTMSMTCMDLMVQYVLFSSGAFVGVMARILRR